MDFLNRKRRVTYKNDYLILCNKKLIVKCRNFWYDNLCCIVQWYVLINEKCSVGTDLGILKVLENGRPAFKIWVLNLKCPFTHLLILLQRKCSVTLRIFSCLWFCFEKNILGTFAWQQWNFRYVLRTRIPYHRVLLLNIQIVTFYSGDDSRF